jgi:hypothetical protein
MPERQREIAGIGLEATWNQAPGERGAGVRFSQSEKIK